MLNDCGAVLDRTAAVRTLEDDKRTAYLAHVISHLPPGALEGLIGHPAVANHWDDWDDLVGAIAWPLCDAIGGARPRIGGCRCLVRSSGRAFMQLPPPPRSRREDPLARGVFGVLFVLLGLYLLMRAIWAEPSLVDDYVVFGAMFLVLGIPVLGSVLRTPLGRVSHLVAAIIYLVLGAGFLLLGVAGWSGGGLEGFAGAFFGLSIGPLLLLVGIALWLGSRQRQ